jgi:hypothetical protein
MRAMAMAMRVAGKEEGESSMAMVMVTRMVGKQQQWQQIGQWQW